MGSGGRVHFSKSTAKRSMRSRKMHPLREPAALPSRRRLVSPIYPPSFFSPPSLSSSWSRHSHLLHTVLTRYLNKFKGNINFVEVELYTRGFQKPSVQCEPDSLGMSLLNQLIRDS